MKILILIMSIMLTVSCGRRSEEILFISSPERLAELLVESINERNSDLYASLFCATEQLDGNVHQGMAEQVFASRKRIASEFKEYYAKNNDHFISWSLKEDDTNPANDKGKTKSYIITLWSARNTTDTLVTDVIFSERGWLFLEGRSSNEPRR